MIIPKLNSTKVWIGNSSNIPVEANTVITTISVGDFSGTYSGLATETNWVNNFTSAISGSSGDFHFGVGSIGCSYYAYYGQSGWNRVYTDNRITYASLIASLETTGNWTGDTYNTSIGDLGQIYINGNYEYRCIDGTLHTWYRNILTSNITVVTDSTYFTYPQIEIGVADNGTFIIPAKTDIISLRVEAETTTAGNISIGSTSGGTDVVSSTALPTTIGIGKKLLYIDDPDYPTNSSRTLYVNIDSAATVKLQIINLRLY